MRATPARLFIGLIILIIFGERVGKRGIYGVSIFRIVVTEENTEILHTEYALK
jgi:hypothetical protein